MMYKEEKCKMKYRSCFLPFIVFFLVFQISLCLFPNGTASAAAKVTFPGKTTVMAGKQVSLKLAGNTNNVTYTSSNAKIVKIIKKTKSEVVIRGQKVGTANITAKVGKNTYVCKVTVSPILPEITVTTGEIGLVELAAGSGSVKWSSSNSSVVKIQKTDRSGATVKGIAPGKAAIRAKIGKNQYSCIVTVTKPVSMKTKLTITVGDTSNIKLENNNENAAWSTSNNSVVKIVSKSNKSVGIKGVAPGTAKITAKIGKKTFVCTVTVKAKVSLTSKVTVTIGKTKKIVLKNNTAKVEWSSSNKKVVKLQDTSSGSAVLYGAAPGSATVTAKIGSKRYTCSVTVVEPEYTYKITPLLAPFNEYFYVQTEDPDVSDIAFADKKSVYYSAGEEPDRLTLCKNTFLDVKYEKKATFRVKGGYIFKSENYTLDGGTLYLQKAEQGRYSWDVTYTDTNRKVTCPRVKTSVQYLIDTYTKSGMSFFAKLDAVEAALDKLAIYPRSTLDVTKKNTETPYPLLTVSPYPELYLNEWYLMYDYSEDGQLLNRLYPYVLDSLGFPGMMSAVAKRLNSSCRVTWGELHYLINVTLNGKTRSYGGAGNGSRDPLRSNHVKKVFLFDGSEKDYATHKSLKKLADKQTEYGKVAEKDSNYYKDMLTGVSFAKTIGMGSWVRVGTEGFNLAARSYAYVTAGCPYPYSEDLDYTPSAVKDTWVDGRYINAYTRYEKGATFSQHPTADIIIRNMTYKNVKGKTCHGDVKFSYNKKTNTWVSYDYTKENPYWGTVVPYEELPDEMILTQKEVKALKVDRNTNRLPSSGYIYDGSVKPGTAF